MPRTVTVQVGSGTPQTYDIADTATSTEVRTQIQQRIDAAEDSAAGQPIVVTLSAGTFVVNGTGTPSAGCINIGSNVTLQGTVDGSGNKLTTIQLDPAYAANDVTGIVRTTSEPGVQNATIKDLVITGRGQDPEGNGFLQNLDQKVDGIYCGVAPGATHDPAVAHNNITIQNVDVSQCSRYGIDPHEQITNLTITNSVSHNNGVDGFTLDYVEGGTLSNNEAYGNGRHGFNLVTGTYGIVMTGNVAYGNGTNSTEQGHGIVIQPPAPRPIRA